MKDATFRSNSKLFEEVEEVKKVIRDDIHSKCRNYSGDGPAAKPSSSKSELDKEVYPTSW